MTPNDPLDEEALGEADEKEIHTALFCQLVAGHTQMALMFLGEIENPHTGEKGEAQLEPAKIFIDQLEMLVAKTRGNLEASETELMERSLATVHSAFARALDAQSGRPAEDSGPA